MSSRPSPAATESRLSVDASGTIHLPPMSVPLSNLLSDEAKAGLRKYFRFLASQEDDDMFSLTTQSDAIEEQRRRLAENDAPKIQRLRELYPTEIAPRTIAGVLVDVVTPKDGISSRNARRVLIELHGGGFLFGARSCVDSIPVASIGEITVLSVDYRQGPEHRFPAASEDVVAVYRELLESYEPQNIGIYGCSAGGVLTAESMAWIDKEKLPTPGALGILCAGAGGWGDGDSGFLNNALIGYGAARPDTMRHPAVSDTIYFADADFSDPLVAPIRSDELLSRFPPTLVLTSTRDAAASSAVYTHTRLSGVGVETRLHVWEGQPHGFLSGEPDFPESRAAWETVVRFFDTFLGRDE